MIMVQGQPQAKTTRPYLRKKKTKELRISSHPSQKSYPQEHKQQQIASEIARKTNHYFC
jgi:hypothetical protein